MVNSHDRPLIAITLGDAAGVGPEIIVKALESEDVYRLCKPVVIGEKYALQRAVKLTGTQADIRTLQAIEDAGGRHGEIDLLDLHNLPADVAPGKLSAECGRAAVEYITLAAELALDKRVAAIATAPINKEATRLAGCGELGHMEILARLTGTTDYATMLTAGHLRVVHLTTHHSLKNALNFVTQQHILSRLHLTWQSLLNWGFMQPRIGVAALNPHGGEGGLLGDEEGREIVPAVAQARLEGMNVSGPFPADTIFVRAIQGEFDAVLALYHDQGHIPIKVHNFDVSVSVALGFPFVRTSVDHGTAFDIAGRGIASPSSMMEAIKTAVGLSQRRRL